MKTTLTIDKNLLDDIKGNKSAFVREAIKMRLATTSRDSLVIANAIEQVETDVRLCKTSIQSKKAQIIYQESIVKAEIKKLKGSLKNAKMNISREILLKKAEILRLEEDLTVLKT